MGKCLNRKFGVSRKHRVFLKNIVFFVGMTFSSVFEAPGRIEHSLPDLAYVLYGLLVWLSTSFQPVASSPIAGGLIVAHCPRMQLVSIERLCEYARKGSPSPTALQGSHSREGTGEVCIDRRVNGFGRPDSSRSI